MAELTPPLPEGYSIWFMAQKAERERLQGEIDRLAHEYGGDQFMVHGTVVGLGEKKEAEFQEIAQKTQELTQGVKKFEVEAIGLGMRKMYFQSLFLVLAPPVPLVEMNRKARVLFGHENNPPYMPHISLMYGNFDFAVKKQAVASINFTFPMNISIASIAIVATGGNPSDWKIVEEYPLQ